MVRPNISRTRRVGNLLFLSGMVGDGETTKEQTESCLNRIKNILEENGSSLENVVSATIYVTDITERPDQVNPVWNMFFKENPPTRTCVEIGLAPPKTIEITVISTVS